MTSFFRSLLFISILMYLQKSVHFFQLSFYNNVDENIILMLLLQQQLLANIVAIVFALS